MKDYEDARVERDWNVTAWYFGQYQADTKNQTRIPSKIAQMRNTASNKIPTTLDKQQHVNDHHPRHERIGAGLRRHSSRGRVREDRRQVDVKGQEHETDGTRLTRDKHAGRAVPGISHRLCLRFRLQRVFILLRLRPMPQGGCKFLLVSFTLFLRFRVRVTVARGSVSGGCGGMDCRVRGGRRRPRPRENHRRRAGDQQPG